VGKKHIDDCHNVWNKNGGRKILRTEKTLQSRDDLFDDTENEIFTQKKRFEENKRADGRKNGRTSVTSTRKPAGSPSQLHGSGIFYRGGTHVLSVLTLGGPEDRNFGGRFAIE